MPAEDSLEKKPAQPSPALHPLLVSSQVMRRMQGRPQLPGSRAGTSRPASHSRVEGRVILGGGGGEWLICLVRKRFPRGRGLSRVVIDILQPRIDSMWGDGRQAYRQPLCTDKGTCRGRWLRIAHAVAADTSHHTTPAWLAGWVAGPRPPTCCSKTTDMLLNVAPGGRVVV